MVSILFTLASNLSYSGFLTTSFLQNPLGNLNQQEQAPIYQYLIYQLHGYKLTKFVFNAKLEVSTCKIFLMFAFVAQLDKSTLTLISPPNLSYSFGKYCLIFIQ